MGAPGSQGCGVEVEDAGLGRRAELVRDGVLERYVCGAAELGGGKGRGQRSQE